MINWKTIHFLNGNARGVGYSGRRCGCETCSVDNRLVTTASLEKYVPINIWWLESLSAAAIG